MKEAKLDSDAGKPSTSVWRPSQAICCSRSDSGRNRGGRAIAVLGD
jgi:hypothetical protein